MGYAIGRRVAFISVLDPAIESALDRLGKAGINVVRRHDLAGSSDRQALAAALDGCWGVIAGNEGYDASVLAGATSLRVIARPGSGYDGVDLAAASQAGVLVFRTPGANANAVADLTLGLMLAALRRIPSTDAAMRSGGWPDGYLAPDLHGSTVGLIGLGAIGRAVARRLIAFDCEVLAVEPAPDHDGGEPPGIELVGLDELLHRSMIVSLHASLSPTTRHLIGHAQIQVMRPDAILVNTARGGIVDEAALIAAITSGRIAGAALDVYGREPLPADSPLRSLPNVVLSSHVAARTAGAMRRMLDEVVDGLLAVARDDIPAGCLNPEAAGQRSPA